MIFKLRPKVVSYQALTKVSSLYRKMQLFDRQARKLDEFRQKGGTCLLKRCGGIAYLCLWLRNLSCDRIAI